MPKLTCVLNINVDTEESADAFKERVEKSLPAIKDAMAGYLFHPLAPHAFKLSVPMCFIERFEGKEQPSQAPLKT